MRLNKYAILFVILVYSPIVSVASDNKTSSSIVKLDSIHASVLWHKLMKREVDSREELQFLQNCFISNMEPSFADEFDKRRQLKKAEAAYNRCKSEIKDSTTFTLQLFKKTGDYDFKSKAFPVSLPDGGEDLIIDTYNQGYQTPSMMNTFPNAYRIIYNIPEDLRSIEVSEKFAEKLMPRIHQTGYVVLVELQLKALSANEQDAQLAGLSFKSKNIFFKVIGFKVILPPANDMFGQNTLHQKPIALKNWVPGKTDKKYNGPSMEGSWGGIWNHESTGGFDSNMNGILKLALQQSRMELSGTYHHEFSGNSQNSTIEDGHVSGQIDENGDFKLDGGPGDGNEIIIAGHLNTKEQTVTNATVTDSHFGNQTYPLDLTPGAGEGKSASSAMNPAADDTKENDTGVSDNPQSGNEIPPPPDNSGKTSNDMSTFPSSDVAVIFNIPGVTKLNLVPGCLVSIFSGGKFGGEFINWNDSLFPRWNSGETFPDSLKITIVRNSDDKLSEKFSSFLCVNHDWAQNIGTIPGDSPKWPVGVVGNDDDGVADLVNKTPGAIGFVHASYATENNLPVANIGANFNQ